MAIRVARDSDAQDILDIYGPFCLPDSVTSFEFFPPDVDEMRSRIVSTLETHPWLVYEKDGRVVGYASASRYHARAAYDWSVTVSIYLHQSARGLKIGTKLYTRLFQILREMGFFNAYAGITMPNAASIALHKSFGFVDVGLTPNVGYKAERWLDVALMWLALQPHVDDPHPPKRFSEVSFDPI